MTHSGQPLELSDITGAGKAEYFRQWTLIGRRQKYDPEQPISRLWVTIGGSAGHSCQVALDIDESRDESGERAWDLTLQSTSHAVEELRSAKQSAKREAKRQTLQCNVKKLREVYGDGDYLTDNIAKSRSRLNTESFKAAMDKLAEEGSLESGMVKKRNNHSYTARRLRRSAEEELLGDQSTE
ncbi:MAG: hypothetical protein F9B45_24885 [Phycisphaera sp. RhM]|nr:hypothetical protein [Phycisphaera sp. RhM]